MMGLAEMRPLFRWLQAAQDVHRALKSLVTSVTHLFLVVR
jgi:hypothetical protein